MEGLFWLLLPVAAYSGWYAASKHFQLNLKKEQKKAFNSNAHSNYSEGFNTFLTEQTDRAVDFVISQFDVTPETVEVHMALGNLYRRTGQVDRAIRLHQNLTEKLGLNLVQREQVLYELGQDYASSGLYDRAESIMKDLLHTNQFAKSACKSLVEIYEKEKEWDQAIEALKKYEKLSGKKKKEVISQYYCEIAKEYLVKEDREKAYGTLQEALRLDKRCVRASMMLADYYYQQDELKLALDYYYQVLKQDDAFLSEIIEPMLNCLLVINKKECLSASVPAMFHQYFEMNGRLVSDTAVIECEKNKKSQKFIEDQLKKQPSVKLLSQYLYLNIDDHNSSRQILNKVNEVLKHIVNKEAAYRCACCGFTSHNLHWHCPGCANWNSIKPI